MNLGDINIKVAHAILFTVMYYFVSETTLWQCVGTEHTIHTDRLKRNTAMDREQNLCHSTIYFSGIKG